MKIVHIALQHAARDSRIYHKECISLSEDYEVHLLTPDNGVRSQGSVEFQSALPYPEYDGSMGRWLIRYVRCLSWNIRVARGLRAKVYHIHETPLIPLALVLKITGMKVVYDVHEDAPRQAVSNGQNLGRPLLGYAYACVCWSYEALAKLFLDGFAAATPEIARKFPSSKTVVVRNFVLRSELEALDTQGKEQPYHSRPKQAIYIGGLTRIRGVREIVEAAGRVAASADFRLVTAGKFDTRSFHEECQSMAGWKHVDYLGMLDRRGVIGALSKSRIGLVTIHPLKNYRESWPVKLFEYMAAGIPVIASDFPEWRRLFERYNCIRFVDPLNVAAIARELLYLLENPQEAETMGERGKVAVREELNWEHEAINLRKLYMRVVGKPGRCDG